MSMTEQPRAREITRAIHRLFIRATLENKASLAICFLTRIPALVLYHVVIPLQIAYGIQAIIERQFDDIPGYALRIMLCAVGYSILWGIGGWTISTNGAEGSKYVQRAIFTNFLSKDYAFFGNSFFGALGSQAVQLRSAYNEYSQVFLLFLPNHMVILVAGIAVIAWNSVTLAAVTLVAMSAVLSFVVWFSKWRLRLRRELSSASSELAGVVGDALSQGNTVKSFASESYEEKNLERPLDVWARIQFRTWASSIPADGGRMMLAALATCVMLVITARLYQQGAISIAVVTLVQLYVIKMIMATEALAALVKQYENVMGSAYQSVKTMLVAPTVLDPAQPRPFPKKDNTIQFNDLTYRYTDAGKHTAIADFDLHITPGEKVGIVGYSGSGKTTLTKLLLRFMDATSGSIAIGGVNIRDMRQHDLRSHIAYVPQEPMLFHRTILENVSYGRPGATKQQVRRAAELAFVHEFVRELPDGYDTVVGERGVKLSGGQRQRVAIARALLKDAPILLLDEATSALDSRSEKLIQQALWQLMKHRTAVVIAHRLSTIQRMDKIVVMQKGRIVQVGTHDELVARKSGVYAQLWAHQSGGYIGVPEKQSAAAAVVDEE